MSELDQMIISIVIRDAERLVSDGCSPEEATVLSTPGSWAQFQPQVLGALAVRSFCKFRKLDASDISDGRAAP